MTQPTTDAAATLQTAMQHHREGRREQAEHLYRSVLARDPNDATAAFLTGVLALESDRLDLAVEMFTRATTVAPQNAMYFANLGEAERRRRRVGPATSAFLRAMALKPDLAAPYNNFGLLLDELDEVEGAIACYERAAELLPTLFNIEGRIAAARMKPRLRPPSVAMLIELASALGRQGRGPMGIAIARRALEIDPMYLAGHCNLGNMLFGEDLIDDAIATYRRALELDPRETNVLSNLAGALARRGQVDEALDLFRQALGLKPEDDRTRSSLLFQMHFSPSCPARDILQAAREWDRHHGAPLAARHVPHGNDRTPDRRLRVGYVSPDFRRHCQSLFVAPLLANHDHERFEIFCYADVSNPDPFTSEVLRHADRWRSIAEVDDDVVAALIREDRIDVLVDLTMHMGNNRLRVFARKPAPVQITWLAYPGTTGLSAIDYRLSDPILDPPGSDTSVYAEQTLRLPDVYWCYAPLTSDEDIRAAPDRLPPPADGHVRFGCLNNFCKVHEAVIALWSRVLQAVPGSTMAVLVPPGESRVRARATFEKYGIPGDRLEFLDKRARPEYLATYRCMDVCLDTFPYNGHTTSLDAFWMGTPVVTLVAPTVVGRAGLCQATHLELPELVAHDDDDYVTIATRLAMDRPRLAELRATLRSRMERSPLMDAPRFARGMEVALRTAWESWCVSA